MALIVSCNCYLGDREWHLALVQVFHIIISIYCSTHDLCADRE